MIVNPISNGIVLDHIKAGNAMKIYDALNLADLECSVAIIINADSSKSGKKDILKIFDVIDLKLDVIGYIDPGITVNIIKDGKVENRFHVELPEKIENIIRCRNPRCITMTEQEIPHVFKLVDPESKLYRCMYCESSAKEN